MRKRRLLFIAPLAMIGIALFIAVGGEAVKLLWNWLLPSLFGWHAIGFRQAVGLLALCRILFGGLGRSGVGPSMRRRMREKWDGMSPEERERFRQAMRERCGS